MLLYLEHYILTFSFFFILLLISLSVSEKEASGDLRTSSLIPT